MNNYKPIESLHKIYGIILQAQKKGELRIDIKNLYEFQILCHELEYYLVQENKKKKEKEIIKK